MYLLVPKIQICPATLITLEIVARCRYYPTTLKPSTTLPRSHTANHIIVTLPHFARKSFWNLSLDVAEMGKNIFGLLSYYFKKPSILLRSHCRILPGKKNHFSLQNHWTDSSLRSIDISEFCEILLVQTCSNLSVPLLFKLISIDFCLLVLTMKVLWQSYNGTFPIWNHATSIIHTGFS